MKKFIMGSPSLDERGLSISLMPRHTVETARAKSHFRYDLTPMSDRMPQLCKLHEADPSDVDVPYMIALEHAKAEEHATAIDWLDKTLALDAGYHYAYFQKAKMLSELGEDQDALAVLDAGITRATADGHAKAASELEELKLAIQ